MLFEHTADLGLESTGRDMKELAENAAADLVDLIIDRGDLVEKEERLLTVRGEDREELLIDFLREVLYLVNGEGFLPKTIKVVTLDGGRLICRLAGEPYQRDEHELKREIKAVTYNASIEEGEEGLTARVVLDV